MVKRPDHAADDEATVWEALAGVHDPEIPPISITDLGVVERVSVTDEAIEVDLLPTFSGCPALDEIRQDVETALGTVGGARATRVRFVHAPTWTTDRITPNGREALRTHGLAPPSGATTGLTFVPLASLGGPHATVRCPFCGSDDTTLESAFGPTLCRSTHHCRACLNPFEAFKPKTR